MRGYLTLVLFLLSACGSFAPRIDEVRLENPGYVDCSDKHGWDLVDCSVHNAVIAEKMKTAVPVRKEISRVRRDEDFVTVTYRACWVAKDDAKLELKCALEPEDVYDPTLWAEFKNSIPWTAGEVTVLGVLVWAVKTAIKAALIGL